MQGTILFEYDPNNDVVIATPKWKIEADEDCDIWCKQWEDGLTKYNKKVDLIIVLDDFIVDTKIAAKWGEFRAKIIRDFTRFSYRVNTNLEVGIFVKTSGILYNASSKEAKSIESAIEAIKEERKKAGVS